MRPLAVREQIIAGVAAALVLFFGAYRLGLGDTLAQLGTERERLATLRAQCGRQCESLRNYPLINAEYERYGSYSLPRRSGIDPADEFTEYVSNVIRSVDPNRVPTLRQTDEEPIEGVPNYKQILLPIEMTTQMGPLVELLRTFDEERLLIRRLEIRSRVDQQPDMTVKITLSRFVPVETRLPEGQAPSEAGTQPVASAPPQEATP